MDIQCKWCNSNNVSFKSYRKSEKDNETVVAHRYRCNDCKRSFSIKVGEINYDTEEIDFPYILIFDIETAPLRAYVWARYKQNVYPDQMINEWYMLTWAAKWLYSTEVMSDKLYGEESKKEDDSRITSSLWGLIDKADIIVAHNGDRFDVPRIKNRFLVNGLKPPSPFKTVDTKKIAKELGFSSNKLVDINRIIGLDNKLDTDFELWSRCVDGEDEALEEMEEYNKQDIEALEQTYITLRPWMGSKHPNVGLYMDTDDPVCYMCGSKNLVPNGWYYTAVGKYEAFQCQNCGAQSRGRFTQVEWRKRKKLVRSIAKH